MGIVSLHHCKIDVEDMSRSLDFYSHKLGFREIVRYPLIGGGLIVQVSLDGKPPGLELWSEPGVSGFKNDRFHVAFTVKDLRRTVAGLRARDVVIEREPFQLGHELICFLRDPDGYLIEFNEELNPPKTQPD